MTLMVDAAPLKAELEAAEQARIALEQAQALWVDLQAKLFASPPDPRDVQACEAQERVVEEAKAHHAFCMGYVVASLRIAVGRAERRQSTAKAAGDGDFDGDRYTAGLEYVANGSLTPDGAEPETNAPFYFGHSAIKAFEAGAVWQAQRGNTLHVSADTAQVESSLYGVYRAGPSGLVTFEGPIAWAANSASCSSATHPETDTASPEHVSTALDAMPPEVAELIRPLKVCVSLVHSLRAMENAAWPSTLESSLSRASALAISALVYGDLTDNGYNQVWAYLRTIEADRRNLLSELEGRGA